MIVSLFVDEKCRTHMKRKVVPRIGETIVLDCGEMVLVVEVNHDWDDPNRVQLNCVEVKIEAWQREVDNKISREFARHDL